MEKIAAKQIEGVVDTFSNQNIEGEKTFGQKVEFIPANSGFFSAMRIDGNFLYWLQSFDNPNMDGNIRIGPHPLTNYPVFQRFEAGYWQDIDTNKS